MMIRTLLLLLCAFFLSWGADDHIDWHQCVEAMACFSRQSCIIGKNDDQELMQFTTNLKKGNCDVVVQIRSYSDKKWHIMMQVNASESPQPIADSGISFEQEKSQFACSKSGLTGNTDLFKIIQRGSYRFEDKFIYCSFILETKAADTIADNFKTNSFHPILKIGSASLKYVYTKDKFWSIMNARCNPDMIETSLKLNAIYRHDQIDKYAFPPIACEAPRSLIITRANGTSTVLQTNHPLHCPSTKWTYDENLVSVKIPEEEQFNVVCGERFCSLCTRLDLLNSPGCSPPKQDERTLENCTTAVCPENQWLLKDGRVLTGEMECKQEMEPQNSRNAAWYLKTSNETVAVSKAACFNKTVCWSTVKFTTACPEGMECEQYLNANHFSELWCPGNLTMRWSVAGGAVRNTSRIRCHFPTGTYRDDNSVEVPTASNLVCGRQKEIPPTFAAASFKYGAEVGGGLGALLFIAALVVIGMVLVRKKTRRAKEAAQKAAWEATFYAIVKPPTLEEDMKHNKILARFDKTPWLSRDRNAPVIEPSDKTALKLYDNAVFTNVICEEFTRYSLENRKTIFYNLTQFAYAKVPEDGNEVKDYGNFNHFWQLFMACVRKNLDCIVTWEMIFRMYRILFERMMKKGFDTPDNKLAKRMKARLYDFARPILNELGWRIKEGESDSDTWMRFFVVRVLLFTGDEYVMNTLQALADFKREPEPEAPLRAVIWQYIVQKSGGHKEFKKKHWKTVLEDPENKATDKFGTKRQHLLYALATARDRKFSEKILDETWRFTKLKLNMFTPQDQFWAYRGATESIHRKDKERVVLHYCLSMADNLADIRGCQLALKYPNKTPEELEPLKKDWMQATMDTANLIAESCYNSEQLDMTCGSITIHHKEQLKQRAKSLALRFESDSQKKKTKKEQLKQRVKNLALRFQEKKSRKQLIESFIKSFATIEEEAVVVPPPEQMEAVNTALPE